MQTQGEGGHLRARPGGLRRSRLCPHPVSGFYPPDCGGINVCVEVPQPGVLCSGSPSRPTQQPCTRQRAPPATPLIDQAALWSRTSHGSPLPEQKAQAPLFRVVSRPSCLALSGPTCHHTPPVHLMVFSQWTGRHGLNTSRACVTGCAFALVLAVSACPSRAGPPFPPCSLSWEAACGASVVVSHGCWNQ